MNEVFTIETPVGRLAITIEADHVKKIKLNSESSVCVPQTAVGKIVVQQIKQYFESSKFEFDLPLQQQGTEHQLKVWSALSKIPVGTVQTYGELAKKIGSHARAIGGACRNNPLPIVVPCHRIVAASDIGGFSGAQEGVLLNIKRDLLCHEGLNF